MKSTERWLWLDQRGRSTACRGAAGHLSLPRCCSPLWRPNFDAHFFISIRKPIGDHRVSLQDGRLLFLSLSLLAVATYSLLSVVIVGQTAPFAD